MITHSDYDKLKSIITALRALPGYSSLSEGEKSAVLIYVIGKDKSSSDDGRGEIV